MFITADILGLGHAPSSFGFTLALAIIFLGIGIVANLLIVYAAAEAKKERDQNLERIAAFDAVYRSDKTAEPDRARDEREQSAVSPS